MLVYGVSNLKVKPAYRMHIHKLIVLGIFNHRTAHHTVDITVV